MKVYLTNLIDNLRQVIKIIINAKEKTSILKKIIKGHNALDFTGIFISGKSG